MADVQMPQLGETVTEGTITRWFKNVGDQVAMDEVLFEVSTDKVDSEVPSPVAGYLAEIRAPEGETVDVGAVIAVVSDSPPAGGNGSAPSAAPPEPAAAAAPAAPAPRRGGRRRRPRGGGRRPPLNRPQRRRRRRRRPPPPRPTRPPGRPRRPAR